MLIYALQKSEIMRWISILIIFISSGAMAQNGLKRLEKKMQDAIVGFKGQIGFYIEELQTGKSMGHNADTVFATASIVKVPILVGIADKLHRGELKYDDKLIYSDSLLYEGEDILGSFKDGEQITLGKVMMLMMTTSDNTASLWLQSLAGTGAHINQIMDGLGLTHTRVNSRTPGREDARSRYGWGQTTPREMATLFKMIADKKVISAAESERMLRIMGRNYWDKEALSAIPAGVFVASKNGAVNRSRSEVLYVNGKKPYLFSVFTQYNEDQSWEDENEAWVLTRKLSAMAWEYFSK
jgi:beta-lactamase class A